MLTRAERETAHTREHADALAKLRDLVALVSEEAAAALDEREAEKERQAATQPVARAALGPVGPRATENPHPGARPQDAKTPSYLPHDVRAEEKAADIGRKQAAKHGVRDTWAAWLPAWTRAMSQRMCESKGRCLSELSSVPVWVRDALVSVAEPYGGASAIAGRNVLALGVVMWHLGQRLKGKISGLLRQAYTSLTVGPNGMHYSDSAVWHPIHDASGPVEDGERGQRGGRIGAGRNRGFMIALSHACEAIMRSHVPSVAAVPGWMIAPSGWPMVQILVATSEPSPEPPS